VAELNRVKIEKMCSIEKGSTALAKASPGKYPLVTTGAEHKTSRAYQFDAKAVCIPLVSSTGHGTKTLRYVHYQEGKFALGSILAALIPNGQSVLSPRYLHVYLQKNKDRVIVPLMKGAANVSLSVKAISNIEIPLPPYRKQEEIVHKIDSISKEHRGLFTETDVQVNLFGKLRQVLLQEAIEGKLTAKWRKRNSHLISGENQPANLLDKIRSHKDRLIKEGKIPKERVLPPIADDEKLFLLPEGWVRLRDLCSRISDIDHNMPKAVPSGVKFISAKDLLDNGTINFTENIKYITEQDFKRLSNKITPRRGDIIYSRIGACLGKARVVNNDEKFLVSYSCCTIRTMNPNREFVNWLLESRTTLNQARTQTTKNSIPDLGIKKIKEFLVGLPSLAEQEAIVGSINRLTNIFNEIDKQVAQRKELTKLLMGSVLREAFE